MNIFEISKENIDDLPNIKIWEDETLYNSVVIVPNEEIHDSGFRCMTYVFCKGDEVVGKVQCGSDVLMLDWGSFIDPKEQENTNRGWSIDCTPNGFIRIFSFNNIKNMGGYSSYSVYKTNKTF